VVYDDEVIIRAGIGEVGRVWVRINYELANAGGRILASGFTSLAAVNEAGEIQRIPKDVREALKHLVP
jgi:acyl-CoA thioesterase FadM